MVPFPHVKLVFITKRFGSRSLNSWRGHVQAKTKKRAITTFVKHRAISTPCKSGQEKGQLYNCTEGFHLFTGAATGSAITREADLWSRQTADNDEVKRLSRYMSPVIYVSLTLEWSSNSLWRLQWVSSQRVPHTVRAPDGNESCCNWVMIRFLKNGEDPDADTEARVGRCDKMWALMYSSCGPTNKGRQQKGLGIKSRSKTNGVQTRMIQGSQARCKGRKLDRGGRCRIKTVKP